MKRKLLLFLVLFLGMFGFTGCNSKDPVEPAIVDIEISKNPTKLEYLEGDYFDPTGMVVKTVLDNSIKLVVTDYTISKTTALEVNDSQITISWGVFNKNIDITVIPREVPVTLEDVEIKVTEGYTYTVTQDIGNNIQYRPLYSDDTVGEWEAITSEDIASVEYKENVLDLNLEFVLSSKKFEKVVELPIKNVELTSVEEIYTKTPNTSKTYYLHGTVVALACTMKSASAGEYFIKDMNSDAMIAVQGLCSNTADPVYTYTEEVKFKMGDEVVLPVQLTAITLSQSSDYRKPICKYVGSTFMKTAIISSNNPTNLNYDNATIISTQEELQDFLSSSNRLGNYYKLVKLSGDLHYVVYGTSKQHRFFFDENIKSNTAQKCDGSSPVFMDCNTYYTTGKTFNELMFGGNYPGKNDDYTKQLHTSKDIYCFLAGGNLYYHEFVILSADDVQDPTPINLSTDFVAPLKCEYGLGQDLDLSGGKLIKKYNYSLFNEEVSLTKEMIKTSNVNKDVAGDYVVIFDINGQDFYWNVTYLAEIPTKIEVLTAPTKTTYTHREGVNDIDLRGGKLLVTYLGGTEVIDITDDMLQKQESPDWKIGTVNYTLTYKTVTCTLPITFENKAISVDDLLSDETTSGETYDIHAIVIGATSSFQSAELLLMSTETHKIIGVTSMSKLVGTYDLVKLDTTKVNVGDEIIIQLTKSVKTGKSEGQIVGKGIGDTGITSYDSIIVISHNNPIVYDLDNAVVIDSQEDLANFCVSSDRYYTLVKLVDVKTVFYSGRLRLEFEEFENIEQQKINETSPCIIQAGCQGINIFSYWNGLNKGKGNDFTAVGTTDYDVYCLFITTYVGTSGPVSHTFVIMDESWFVKAR